MTTTFDTKSASRQDAAPVSLFTFKGAVDTEFQVERLVRSVCLIPGTTEFGYGTTTVKKVDGSQHENSYAGGAKTDFVRSMEQLLERAPNLTHVSVVVAWHGDDLRIGNCQIKPKVDRTTKDTTPYSWQVGPTTRATADLVSYISGFPAAGGAPSDRSLYECITWLKAKGLDVTVYPFILMDIPDGNTLPNPYYSSCSGEITTQYTMRSDLNNASSADRIETTALNQWDIKPVNANDASIAGFATGSRFGDVIGNDAYDFYLVYDIDPSGFEGMPIDFMFTEFVSGEGSALNSVKTDAKIISFQDQNTNGVITTVSVLDEYLTRTNGGTYDRTLSGTIPADSGLIRIIIKCPYALTLSGYSREVLFGNFDVCIGSPVDDDVPEFQPAYPWRGRITCDPGPGVAGTVDQTAAAATQVSNFFGTVSASDFGWDGTNKIVTYSGPASEWSFRRHILHLATIADAAGADDFLIGTEMVEMNRIRSARSTFPAVGELVDLLGECRTILGSGVKISYAADWSEWNGYRLGDGTGDIHFHLDKLWADSDIDYIGIDNYMKLSDWRDGKDHLDYVAGFTSIYDLNYLRSNVEGGEDYDFYYASASDRDNQVRSPISDGGYGKPWVYAQKDLRNWWKNTHVHRIDGIETTTSAWVPESKPITFTELGCSATSRGANQPNVFVDPKSSENSFPYYSKQVRDDHMQRAFLEAELSYWEANNEPGMLDLDRISIWAWDARPFPDFPEADDFWGDASNWEYGHWLNGRINIPAPLAGTMTAFRYTSHSRPIEYGGFTYEPLPIKPGKTKTEGSLERSSFEVMVPRNSDLALLFRDFKPAHQMMLTILQGHMTDNTGLFLPRWHGRITSTKRKGEELQILGIPSAAALARAGLTRNYQIGCPHVLYGPLCRADKAAATVTGTISDIDGSTITLNGGWEAFAQSKYVTGFVEWTRSNSQIERRRILAASSDVLTLSGPPTELEVADTVSVVLGCGQTVQDCRDLHDNVKNCGACPTIPTKNPMGLNTNNFY